MKLLAEAAPARAAPEVTASHSGSYVLRVVELDERAAREDAVLTRGNARVERGHRLAAGAHVEDALFGRGRVTVRHLPTCLGLRARGPASRCF